MQFPADAHDTESKESYGVVFRTPAANTTGVAWPHTPAVDVIAKASRSPAALVKLPTAAQFPADPHETDLKGVLGLEFCTPAANTTGVACPHTEVATACPAVAMTVPATSRSAPADRRQAEVVFREEIICASYTLFVYAMHIMVLTPSPDPCLPRTMSPMAATPRKKTPRVSAAKKPRYSQAEATLRMLNATSQLLLECAPADVTVARICERAGVHTDYVARYFGSRDELLCQAIEAAFLGIFLSTENPDTPRLQIVLEGKVDIMQLATARIRTIAYLLGCGVSPARFQPSQKQLLESVRAQSTNPNVEDRTRMNLILIGTLIVQGMGVFADINDMTEQQKSDVMKYLGHLSQSGETIQSALGWDKQTTRTTKRAK